MKDLKQSIGYFVKYMKPFKNSVLIMVFLLLIAMIAQVVAPYYMGQAVTSLGRFWRTSRMRWQIFVSSCF